MTTTRIEPINTIAREWHTIAGHEDLGTFEFSGSPAYTKAEEIFASTGTRPSVRYHHVNRTTDEVIRDLKTRFTPQLCEAYGNREYGFGLSHDAPEFWPNEGEWIAVFVVTGGSEGWYVHIDHISRRDGKRTSLALAKFLSSQDDALAVANMTTKLLGA